MVRYVLQEHTYRSAEGGMTAQSTRAPGPSPFFSAGWLSQPEDKTLDDPYYWYSRSESPVCFHALSIKRLSSLVEHFVSSLLILKLITFSFVKRNITCKITAKKKGITKHFSNNQVIRILFAKHLLWVIKLQATL